MSIDTVAPAQQLAHLATLAQQLSEAARTLAGAVAATEPAGVADPLPGIDPAPAPASSSPRGSAAELAAYREHLYARIHATGTEGATTAELVAGSSTLNRVKVGLRTLVHQGRVFRTGNGTLRWYSDRNRQALADLMRQAVPAHDLTVPETANLLRLSEQRVRDMATAGQLAGRRVGKTLVIHRDAVLDHIQAIATPHTEGGTTMGRPTKLTPELADRFVTALEEGNSIRRAAALCGITRSTAHLWLARGEEEDAPPEFSDFSDRVTRARTRALGELWNAAFQDAVGGVEVKRTVRPDGSEETQVTPPNGKVALQMMALLDPEEWLPRKAVELSGPGSGPVEVTHQAEVVEGILARVRKAKERRAATAGGVIEATGATGLAETGEGDGDGE